MKRALSGVLVWLIAAAVAMAAPETRDQPFPGTLINAKYVYVTAYDTNQFDPNRLPEDRQAIAAVEDAIQKWGHYVLV